MKLRAVILAFDDAFPVKSDVVEPVVARKFVLIRDARRGDGIIWCRGSAFVTYPRREFSVRLGRHGNVEAALNLASTSSVGVILGRSTFAMVTEASVVL